MEAPRVSGMTKVALEVPFLRILPIGESWRSSIDIELLTVPLDKLPDSFTILLSLGVNWQDTDQESIIIDAKVNRIPNKLWQALATLRYRSKPRYVLAFDLPMTAPQAQTVAANLGTLIQYSEFLAKWRNHTLQQSRKFNSNDPLLADETCLKVLLLAQGLDGDLRVGLKEATPIQGSMTKMLTCEISEGLEEIRQIRIPVLVLEPSDIDSAMIEWKTIYLAVYNIPVITTLTSAPQSYSSGELSQVLSNGFESSLDTLTEAAMRQLRYLSEPRYIHTGKPTPTSKLELGPDFDIVQALSTFVAKWIDPELAVDLSFKRTPIVTRNMKNAQVLTVNMDEALDPMSLLITTAKYQIFHHYRELDVSPESPEVRLMQRVKLEEGYSGPPIFKLVHVWLNDLELPPYVHIQCDGFEKPGETSWGEVIVDGHPLITSRVAANVLGSEIRGELPEFLFVDRICQDVSNEQELAHHRRLIPILIRRSEAQAILMEPNSHASISRINKIEQFAFPELEEGGNGIRLLRLFKSGTNAKSALKMELLVTTLQELKNYEYYALSYVWGEAYDFGPVIINEHKFMVAENLQRALKQLRRCGEDIYCWVDAICINQDDWPERAQQVKLMKEIYINAKQVVAWLGPESDDSDDALAFLVNIGGNSLDVAVGDIQRTKMPESEAEGIHKALMDPKISDALISFYCREWWSRLWILQEASVARDLLICCGQKSLSWNVFERAFAKIDAFIHVTALTSKYATPESVKRRIGGLSNWASAIVMERNRASRVADIEDAQKEVVGDEFLWYLTCLSERRYTEALDIIFCALGLTPHPPSGINVDYSKSVAELSGETAKAILDQQNNLKVLSFAGFSARRHSSSVASTELNHNWWPSWPSWVPDWRMESRGLGSHCYVFSGTLVINPQLKFKASGDSRSDHIFAHEGKLLLVRGVRLGVIQKIIPKDRLNDQSGDATASFYADLHTWETEIGLDEHEASENSIIGAIDKEEAFLRALGLTCWNGVSPESVIAYKAWRSDRKKTGEKARAETAPAMMAEIEESQGFALRDRTLITTTNGYVGIAGDKAAPGDIVCLLMGGTVPYLLRPSWGGNHLLVSDAYIHGIMNGELYEGVEGGRHEIEKFGII